MQTEAVKNADNTWDLYILLYGDVEYYPNVSKEEMRKIIKTAHRKEFLKTRLVSIKEIIDGFKNPVYHIKEFPYLDAILFNARYNAVKALMGYDFF